MQRYVSIWSEISQMTNFCMNKSGVSRAPPFIQHAGANRIMYVKRNLSRGLNTDDYGNLFDIIYEQSKIAQ